MAPVAWKLSGRVEAPPDAVFAWMTDYSEHDHSSEAFLRGSGAAPGKGSRAARRIVSRDGNVLVLEDSWGRRTFKSTVTLDPPTRSLRIAGMAGYEATWRALPDGAGTRVECEGRLAPTGLLALLAPLFAKGTKRMAEQDFEGHLAELRVDLAPGKA